MSPRSEPIAAARPELPAAFASTPIVAVLRARRAADYDRVVEVLAGEEIPSLELTLTTPGALDHLPELRRRVPAQIELGVGTVLSVGEAHQAMAAGADYLVTPTTDAAVIAAAVTAGVRIFPGGLTPTELHAGWSLGATAVKLFPAATVGPGYLSQLSGPFPSMRAIPSGGVGIEDSAAWLRAGAVAVSIGGPLVGDALEGGDLDALRKRARRLVSLVREAVL